jgi:hypothetical protein
MALTLRARDWFSEASRPCGTEALPCLNRRETSRASVCAVAVRALGAPRRLRSRRKKAPRAVRAWWTVRAARRRAKATRCAPGRTRRERTLPPAILCGGESPSQLQQCLTLGQRRMAVPISERMTRARTLCNALNGRQIDPRQAREGGAGLTARCVGFCMAAGLWGERLAVTCVRTGPEVRLEVLSAHGQWLVRALRQCDGGLEGTQVLGPPGALQRFGDLVRTVLAVRGAPRGQGKGIACASHDGCEHGHAGGAGEGTDDVRECERHLLQGLVPRLHRVGAIRAPHLAVASRAAQHADLVVRAAGRREQPRGVQALEPLAVEPIGFRSSGGACGLTRVDQEDLDAARLQTCTHGHPGDPGGCHGHRGDAAVEAPVGEGLEIGGAGAATADRLGGAIRGHGHPVLGVAAIDPRRMGVGELEGGGRPEHRGLRDGRGGGTRRRECVFRGCHGSLHTWKSRMEERRGGQEGCSNRQSPTRDQAEGCRQCCGRHLLRPPSQTGTQHQCGDGHDDPRCAREESKKRVGGLCSCEMCGGAAAEAPNNRVLAPR